MAALGFHTVVYMLLQSTVKSKFPKFPVRELDFICAADDRRFSTTRREFRLKLNFQKMIFEHLWPSFTSAPVSCWKKTAAGFSIRQPADWHAHTHTHTHAHTLVDSQCLRGRGENSKKGICCMWWGTSKQKVVWDFTTFYLPQEDPIRHFHSIFSNIRAPIPLHTHTQVLQCTHTHI